jgi:tetratricopeptide (TPR) repeat protein
MLRILAIRLLLAFPHPLDLGGVADPQLEVQFRQQSLEPARMLTGFHPHAHLHPLGCQVSVELLRCLAWLGLEFFLTRKYDRAIEQERKVLELDPNFIEAYYFRGVAYLKKSMYKEGMAEFEKGVAISPLNT